MPNTAVINMTVLNSYVREPINGSDSCRERIIQFTKKLPDVNNIIILCREHQDFPVEAEEILFENPLTEKEFFTLLYDRFQDEEGTIFYYYGDTPFLDTSYLEKMNERHVHYGAEYTFGDGFPYGFTIEMVSKRILRDLLKLAGSSNDKVERSSIFKTIQKDINNFDLETEISPEDHRLLRLELTTEFKRNKILIDRLAAKGADNIISLYGLINQDQTLLRTIPAFYDIQISGNCPQSCSTCPFPDMDATYRGKDLQMDYDKVTGLLEKIALWTPEAAISFSFWGDPVCHPDIYRLINDVEKYSGFHFLIETSGIGWDMNKLFPLLKKYEDKITLIHSLDAIDPNLYSKFRGDQFEEALLFAETVIKELPLNGYVQIVRMKENEEHLESFYRYWKEKTKKIIIQKYNHFSGLLEQRKVTDLSPIDRNACWAVKREMAIMVNGDVIKCRNQIKDFTLCGNVFTDSLEDIWEKNQVLYLEHLSGSYPDICQKCDEYYVFNF